MIDDVGGLMIKQTAFARTLKDQAIGRIKQAIYSGELPPGKIFSHEQLSNLFGISRTPIREALLEMQKMGIVIIHRGKGTEVTLLSSEDVQEIFEMREALETKAFDLAISRITDAEIKNIIDFFNDNIRQSKDIGKVDFLDRDRKFHMLIAKGSRNIRLYNAIDSLRELFMQTGTYALINTKRMEEVISEHKEMVEALEQRDRVKGRASIMKHIQNTCTESIKATKHL